MREEKGSERQKEREIEEKIHKKTDDLGQRNRKSLRPSNGSARDFQKYLSIKKNKKTIQDEQFRQTDGSGSSSRDRMIPRLSSTPFASQTAASKGIPVFYLIPADSLRAAAVATGLWEIA